MELVVINVGKDLGVIPDEVYCMLVLMTLLTTVMTTPLLVRLCAGTELEPAAMRTSGFLPEVGVERSVGVARPEERANASDDG
jgi:hypothetical protein